MIRFAAWTIERLVHHIDNAAEMAHIVAGTVEGENYARLRDALVELIEQHLPVVDVPMDTFPMNDPRELWETFPARLESLRQAPEHRFRPVLLKFNDALGAHTIANGRHRITIAKEMGDSTIRAMVV